MSEQVEYFFKNCLNISENLLEEDKSLFKELEIEHSDVKDKISSSKILVVGAGGIGCEVLKNLILIGFKNIDIIDLDTIEISNLNRQFLFRRNHISKSKAITARQSVLEFNPDCTINAYHDSIFNTQFGVGYIGNFNFVISALDNRKARNHVNRLCLAANVPLIETGTAGYYGQVEIISKGLTECYECVPKSGQKSYSGCTIRNTPSEPVHCIVWAKYLFNQLFGEEDAENEVSPDSSDPELNNTFDGNVQRESTRAWALKIDYNPKLLHQKIFVDDINYLLVMKTLWISRRTPTPSSIDIDSLNSENFDSYKGLDRTMKVWNWKMCTKVFVESLEILASRYRKLTSGDYLTWDKDDDVALDFVTSCANIRAYIFGIQPKSRFDVKAIAGNIIPAIATTNAIISGLAILQILKILSGNIQSCTPIYLRKTPNPNGELFLPEKKMLPPNKNCYVCTGKRQITIEIDLNKTTLKQFENIVLKEQLNLIAPDVIDPSRSLLILSSEQGETDHNKNKMLNELGVNDGVILDVDDFVQEYKLNIIMKHKVQDNDFSFKIIRANEIEQSLEQEEIANKIRKIDKIFA